MAGYPHTSLIGNRYGKLFAVDMVRKGKIIYYTCVCDCGNVTSVQASNLRSGHTWSCGCIRSAIDPNSPNHHPLFQRWRNMIARCHNQEHKDYKWYGARGIYVCERWHSFWNYVMDVYSTFKPGLELDRIDNDGPYSPENTRWVTHKENIQNQRRS